LGEMRGWVVVGWRRVIGDVGGCGIGEWDVGWGLEEWG
jgi:hypothetical protein